MGERQAPKRMGYKKVKKPKSFRRAGRGINATRDGESKARLKTADLSSPISGTQLTLDGEGPGGDEAAGKLTELRKNGNVEVLGEDQLDPSDKYPLEYREAIQRWFRKPKK